MPDRSALAAAAEELSTAVDRGRSLCRPFLRVLPVVGAAVSTLGAPFGSETVCATDAQAARLDELQFDLGEGPCWQALTERRPVLTAKLDRESDRWPLFTAALAGFDVCAMFAFPLTLGSLNIGAVDLYSDQERTLSTAQVQDAVTLAEICTRQVLRRALTESPVQRGEEDPDGFSRREVHQATGMVLAQLGLTAADALLVINAYAFARGMTVRRVAADIVARRVDVAEDWAPPAGSL
ncbi:GAF and ANTAR domain-containing protein [Cryobacterium sp. 1639]|uniref:GAF and ANTAR domain-containing protein n=1 Tax=Cryobacterium inferilacus TaxID=2866629 RepID=UPI001C732EB7|nr:GAF and ANTAR domain-containing protein [Cryobacterium sp. 1639]MBX0298925.1 GAF and ANTAR domain-containing protein [Cryobacterium sp. 1639]